MAASRETTEIEWIDPHARGIMPLEGFHLSKSLARTMRRRHWTVTVDRDFAGVVQACAAREETWINAEIFQLYTELHAKGAAHSLEIWEDDRMVGGLYGVSLGAAFFGESMFSRATDASKVAMACLVHRLRAGGYQLLDMQFLTPHLQSLGGIEVTRRDYRRKLASALKLSADFAPEGYCASPASISASLSSA